MFHIKCHLHNFNFQYSILLSSYQIQMKASRDAVSPQRSRSPPMERLEMITNTTKTTTTNNISNSNAVQENSMRPSPRGEGAHSPSSPVPPSGKYSLMQFAMQNFRQSTEWVYYLSVFHSTSLWVFVIFKIVSELEYSICFIFFLFIYLF